MPTQSGRVAVGDHLLGEGEEVVERRRHLVALLGEAAGMYQTSDLRSDFNGTPYCVPSTLPKLIQSPLQFSLDVGEDVVGQRQDIAVRARTGERPWLWEQRRCRAGCRPPTSVPICASKSRVPA